MAKEKRVSLKEVANSVGVSPTLVSIVLNGKAKQYRIANEMAEKVIRTAMEMNYSPNLIARNLIALDWMNGRRTPDADQSLKGAIAGLTLGTDAPRIFRALVEATAFGSKAIIERFLSEGVGVDGVMALGGIAKKSPFVMQTLADVMNMPIQVVASEQTCALGAAMYAAVVAGVYPSVTEAQKSMGKGFEKTYIPLRENVEKYEELYQRYLLLGQQQS